MSDELSKAEAELAELRKAKAERLRTEAETLKREQADFEQQQAEMAAKKEKEAIINEVKSQILKDMNLKQDVGIDTIGVANKTPKNAAAIFRSK